MKETQETRLPRRGFLASSSWLLVGAGYLGASDLFSRSAPSGSDLKEELSPAEMEFASKSIMANDMDNYWHKDCGCADTGLMVACGL
jgi:hypothetical protein